MACGTQACSSARQLQDWTWGAETQRSWSPACTRKQPPAPVLGNVYRAAVVCKLACSCWPVLQSRGPCTAPGPADMSVAWCRLWWLARCSRACHRMSFGT